MATAAQEIALMKQRIESLEDKLDSMSEKLDRLTSSLLNPDNGFVSRVNKNTEFRETKLDKYDSLTQELQEIKSWKSTITKAIWVIFATVVGVLVKMFYT